MTDRKLWFASFCPMGVPHHWTSDRFHARSCQHCRVGSDRSRVTFLMVFVIQNTQNRDTAAMHIKIDELIRVTQRARNVLLDLEELDDKTLDLLRKDYEKLARKAKSRTRTPIRAEEVPARPGDAKSRKGQPRG